MRSIIFLFTDFGAEGPYLGQVEAVLRGAGCRDVINLVSNAPCFAPEASAFLLAALLPHTPPGSVIIGVVDPGVGGARDPVALHAEGRWFVGPENGLFNTVAARADQPVWYRIDWRPESLSASFHGRDLFAPVAAGIVQRGFGDLCKRYPGPNLGSWPAELDQLIYFDAYGNALTGRRYGGGLSGKVLRVGSHRLAEAGTFCAVERGTPFWYRNSIGLVEVAVSGGSAREVLQLRLGMEIAFA